MDGMAPTLDALHAALATVNDPEIHRPITDLGMVADLAADDAGKVAVTVLLTIAGCPMRSRLEQDVTAALMGVDGVTAVDLTLGVMDDDQRAALRQTLRGGAPDREIPFAQPNNLTRVYAVASGKGGVGKSSVTANLAAAMAADGLKVGVLDADIYGFSIPRMLGVTEPPTQLDDGLILPAEANGIKVVSVGMFTPNNQPVLWRGPMLTRALQQFLTDFFWGDLDVLLLDLPPGTGDVAMSVPTLIPGAEIIVVTTPQQAAAEVAERAGSMAVQTHQRIVGVIENMAWFELPDGTRSELFGSGGGQSVADSLTRILGTPVPLLGQVPIDPSVSPSGDAGTPVVLSNATGPAGTALRGIARQLMNRQRGLAGRKLGISPTPR